MAGTVKKAKETSSYSFPTFSLSEAYILSYNVFQFLGWFIILVQTIYHFGNEGFVVDGLWNSTIICLLIFQTLAVIEVLHALFGLVKNKVLIVLVQVFSRLFILWPICYAVNDTHKSLGFALLLVAWSVTEVIRYAYYFMHQVGKVPYFLTYFRYTLFIVLYPMGVTGELLCAYLAIPYLRSSNSFSVRLPNSWNFTFSFYIFAIIVVLGYFPLFPQLYLHMFRQRKRILHLPTDKAKLKSQ